LYSKLLAGPAASLALPQTASYAEPVFHVYVVRSEDRDGLQAHLEAKGISTVIHYPVPIHRQPAFTDLGHGPGSFPITEAFAERILSLPMYAELDSEDIEYVCDAVEEFVSAAAVAPLL
jgi:dTDP-4-amino-4,6-dideoxygalactose transaminase